MDKKSQSLISNDTLGKIIQFYWCEDRSYINFQEFNKLLN